MKTKFSLAGQSDAHRELKIVVQVVVLRAHCSVIGVRDGLLHVVVPLSVKSCVWG